jgi:hypothetical protein
MAKNGIVGIQFLCVFCFCPFLSIDESFSSGAWVWLGRILPAGSLKERSGAVAGECDLNCANREIFCPAGLL